MQAGEIIYKAFMPTLAMALCILTGLVVSVTGILPSSATKGIGIVTMTVCLPCLIFASMVSAFNSDNISAFGPLALVAIIYELLGLLGAWIVREIFYVPADFQWGILLMGLLSNWGNLPTSVVQIIALDKPFNGKPDVDLGIAYISVFLLIFNCTFWPTELHRLCGWDFDPKHRVVSTYPWRVRWAKRITRLRGRRNFRLEYDVEENAEHKRESQDELVLETVQGSSQGKSSGAATIPDKETTIAEAVDGLAHRSSNAGSVAGSETRIPSPAPTPPKRRAFVTTVWHFISTTPGATWAVLLGLPFSLAPPLKALITPTPGWTGGRMPNAPDGNPPLHFVLQTTTQLGAPTVPLALILLGASFARLKMPKRWSDLPLPAITAMTAVKMVILPVISVFMIQGMQSHTNMFPLEDKVRTFVAILLSGTPAAANQLVITQLYNPEGTSDTLASFLLMQYALLFVLNTALAAIALYIIR